MRSFTMLAMVLLAGCGGSVGPQGSTGGPRSFTLSFDSSGDGTLSAAGTQCRASHCTASFAEGTAVQVTASPDSGASFAGFTGDCSGASCSLIMSADRAVAGSFTRPPPPPPPASRSFTVTVAGSGSVKSTPAGIDCPGICTASFAQGTSVSLAATPAATANFVSWSGACAGAASPCVHVLDADAQAGATFADKPADDCAGITPDALGPSVTATVPNSTNQSCHDALSDQQGNVALSAVGRFGPYNTGVFTPGGAVAGTLAGNPREVLSVDTGFQGITLDGSSSSGPHDDLKTFRADGTEARSQAIGEGRNNNVYPSSDGGSVLVSFVCGSGVINATVSRFDATGSLLSAAPLGGNGCVQMFAATADQLGNTLVVALTGGAAGYDLGANRVIARWLDGSGNALTPWFDAGPQLGNNIALRPVIGGGAVLENEERWIASFRSGVAAVYPPPAFLANQYDVRIIRGRRGYALIPSEGLAQHDTLVLYSPAGRQCGSVKLPGNPILKVGSDGTVFGMTDASVNQCSATWWAHLLR